MSAEFKYCAEDILYLYQTYTMFPSKRHFLDVVKATEPAVVLDEQDAVLMWQCFEIADYEAREDEKQAIGYKLICVRKKLIGFLELWESLPITTTGSYFRKEKKG